MKKIISLPFFAGLLLIVSCNTTKQATLGDNGKIDITIVQINDVYEIGFNHALQIIQQNGGKVVGDNITIKVQQPNAVRFEESFTGHYPIEKRAIRKNLTDEITFDFEGSNDKNLARFYKSFGSKECVYLQIKKNNLPFPLKLLKK